VSKLLILDYYLEVHFLISRSSFLGPEKCTCIQRIISVSLEVQLVFRASLYPF
jgi:hypothetical protein